VWRLHRKARLWIVDGARGYHVRDMSTDRCHVCFDFNLLQNLSMPKTLRSIYSAYTTMVFFLIIPFIISTISAYHSPGATRTTAADVDIAFATAESFQRSINLFTQLTAGGEDGTTTYIAVYHVVETMYQQVQTIRASVPDATITGSEYTAMETVFAVDGILRTSTSEASRMSYGINGTIYFNLP
jgi:hypothetical protein